MCSPSTDDADELHNAISSIKPNKRDPAGRNLLSIAQQCQTLLNVKKLVDKFVSTHKRHEIVQAAEAADAALKLSQCDRTAVVMWLESWMVKSLVNLKPWQNGQAGPFELLIDWALCHGPHGKNMQRFLQHKGLDIDIKNWSSCPSALREKAIAIGVCPKPATLTPNSLCCTNTISASWDEFHGIYFLDAGKLVTWALGHFTHWDSSTGSRIKRILFCELRSGQFSTHNCILSNSLLASAYPNGELRSQPNLWSLRNGTFVTSLKPTSEDLKAPKLRAQSYRYIVSGLESGQNNSFRIGVWGRCTFQDDDYEYLHNFRPEYYCSDIVAMGNRLFTCGSTSEKDNWKSMTIDERNLDTNILLRTWTANINCSSIKLLVTTKFFALITYKPERIYVYDRNAFSNKPIRILSHERAYRFAISGQYLVSVADDCFKVWDLCSGDVVQSVHNSRKDRMGSFNNVGFENHTVVIANRENDLQFWTSK